MQRATRRPLLTAIRNLGLYYYKAIFKKTDYSNVGFSNTFLFECQRNPVKKEFESFKYSLNHLHCSSEDNPKNNFFLFSPNLCPKKRQSHKNAVNNVNYTTVSLTLIKIFLAYTV
jgi:hypothetical protein